MQRVISQTVNRPYSKVNKSTRAKVAFIFAHSRFSVIIFFCVVATNSELAFERNSNFDCCNSTESNYTKIGNEQK
jgi:hypothetical protein